MDTTPNQRRQIARERLGTRECAQCGEPTFIIDMVHKYECSLCVLCARDYDNDNNTNNGGAQ